MKRLIVLIALVATLGLVACNNGPSIVEAKETAREFCTGHGGVEEIEYWKSEWPSPSSFDVYCRDGSEIE